MYAQSGPRNMQPLNPQITLGPWRNRTRGQRKMWRCSGSGEALGGALLQITQRSSWHWTSIFRIHRCIFSTLCRPPR